MGEHTPGPWLAGHFSGVVGLPVYAQPNPTENTIIICGVRGERKSAEANGRLIAAAPEMLAALKRVMKAWDEGFDVNFDGLAIDDVEKAIAKAEGRAP